MSDRADTQHHACSCERDWAAVRDQAHRRTAPVRRAAFTALRSGEAPSVQALAERTGLPARGVEVLLDDLNDVGLVRRDREGAVVGIAGLSVEPTPHGLVLDGTQLFTWCVIDAIGIPAALQVDAELTTRCWYCSRPITITLSAGRPPKGRAERVWLPPESDTNVFEQFCSQANVFCDEPHLHAWRAAASPRPGKLLTLAETADLGQDGWAEYAIDPRG